MKSTQKKGIQLGQAFGAVLALVLVAVLVIIAIYLFVSLGSSFSGTSSGSVINETTTSAVTENGVAVRNASLCSFGSLSVLAATNATSGNYIQPANYTVNSATGLISQIAGKGTFNNSLWNISYTYTWGGQACTATNSMTSNFSNYPTLVGLVGTIIFLALVIGVLVSAFAFGGRKGV